MSAAPYGPGSRFHWRWACTPLLVATWICVPAAAVTVAGVARALRDAGAVTEAAELALATFAAEEAAARLAPYGALPAEPGELTTRAGIPVSVTRTDGGFRLEAKLPSGTKRAFRCERLSGRSPRALGLPFTRSHCAKGELPEGLAPTVVAGDELPRLDETAVAAALEAPPIPVFRGDASVALLHLAAGTEREDFRLGGRGEKRVRLDAPNGLLAVPGHLWIDVGPKGLEIELERDVTVVVAGNVYVGCDVRVLGERQLTFVALGGTHGCAFGDRDGNGRWSEGDARCGSEPFRGVVEGSGNVFLGFPAERGKPRACASVELDCGFVVQGELNVATAVVRMHGPLSLYCGVTAVGGGRVAVATTGQRLPRIERQLLPGFLPAGPARAGLLRQCKRADAAERPLYAASARR